VEQTPGEDGRGRAAEWISELCRKREARNRNNVGRRMSDRLVEIRRSGTHPRALAVRRPRG